MIFSSGDKVKLYASFLLIPLLVNVAWYLTKDAALSLAVYLVLLIAVPKLISSLIGRDVYDVLSY